MKRTVHRTTLVMGGARLPMDSPEPPTEAQVFAHFGMRTPPKNFNLERSVEIVELKETIGQLLEAWLKVAGMSVAVMDGGETHLGYLSNPGATFDSWLKERGS